MEVNIFSLNVIILIEKKEKNEPCHEKTNILQKHRLTAKLISTFVFATRIAHCLFFLNQNFPASSHLLCLYSSVCARPGRKPYCRFSHDVAQMLQRQQLYLLIRRCKTLKNIKINELYIHVYMNFTLFYHSHNKLST